MTKRTVTHSIRSPNPRNPQIRDLQAKPVKMSRCSKNTKKIKNMSNPCRNPYTFSQQKPRIRWPPCKNKPLRFQLDALLRIKGHSLSRGGVPHGLACNPWARTQIGQFRLFISIFANHFRDRSRRLQVVTFRGPRPRYQKQKSEKQLIRSPAQAKQAPPCIQFRKHMMAEGLRSTTVAPSLPRILVITAVQNACPQQQNPPQGPARRAEVNWLEQQIYQK